MKLCLQPGVEHRIRAIVLSIGIRYGRAAAERFLTELQQALRRLQRFPMSGSYLPDHPASPVRQVIVFETYRVSTSPTRRGVRCGCLTCGTPRSLRLRLICQRACAPRTELRR